MSLAPGEQRMLAEIEMRFGRSDPGLVAMFTYFTVEGTGKPSPLMRLPRCRLSPAGRARTIILITVSAILLIACVTVAVAVASHARPPRGGRGPGATPAGLYVPGR